MTAKSPILLLHGAWHGAWCWERVARDLTYRGHPVLALDLVGGGLRADDPPAFVVHDPAALSTAPSALAGVSAADYARDAIDATRRLHEAFGPVVVVGHSLSGVVLHHVGEAVPDLVKRLVYLAALAPAPGNTVGGDAAGAAFADSLFLTLPVADPATTGAMRIDWKSTKAEYTEQARQCFYGEVPPALAARASSLLASDVPVQLYGDVSAVTADRWGSVPRAWIRCLRDRAVPAPAQTLNITQLDEAFPGTEPFTVVDLDTDHSPFLSTPDDLVTTLTALS